MSGTVFFSLSTSPFIINLIFSFFAESRPDVCLLRTEYCINYRAKMLMQTKTKKIVIISAELKNTCIFNSVEKKGHNYFPTEYCRTNHFSWGNGRRWKTDSDYFFHIFILGAIFSFTEWLKIDNWSKIETVQNANRLQMLFKHHLHCATVFSYLLLFQFIFRN